MKNKRLRLVCLMCFFFSSLLANHHTNLSAASENNQLTVELQDVKKQLEEGKLSLKPIFYPT